MTALDSLYIDEFTVPLHKRNVMTEECLNTFHSRETKKILLLFRRLLILRAGVIRAKTQFH